MKIFHLLDIPWWSGLSAYAFDSMAAHQHLGHEVFLACQKESLPHRKAQNLGIPVISIFSRKPWFALINFTLISRAIRENQPDVLIAHTGSTHWIAAHLGSQNEIPVFRVRATMQTVKQNIFNKRIYSNTHSIIFASERLRQDAWLRVGQKLKDKFFLLYPPVDTNLTLHKTEGKRIGLLARLDPIKGHSNFIQAIKILQEKFPEIELHLAGPEENLKWGKLLKQAKDLGIKNIFYHGFLPQEKVREFLSSCSLGVIASISSEEVSRALLEWFSVGKPVVATAVGCIPEILKDGKGGFLVTPNHPETLAEKISQLLAQPALAQEMGRFNLELCKDKFSREHFQSKWQEILQL